MFKVLLSSHIGSQYSKFPTYKRSSCTLSKMWTCIPSVSDVREIAAYPLSPIAEGPSIPPSSHCLHRPVSISSHLFTQCQPLRCTTILFKALYCKIKDALFFVSFIYYLCKESYKSITGQYSIATCVSWVSRITLLDLQMYWAYDRALRMELIHSHIGGCTVSTANICWTFTAFFFCELHRNYCLI